MKNKKLKSLLALSFICLISIIITVALILIPDVLVNVDWTLSILPVLSIIVILITGIFNYYKISDEFKKEPEIPVVSLIVVSLLTIMQMLVLFKNIGFDIDVWKLSIICVGFLVSLVGNYFPRAKQNDLFAIYNSWTICNKTIWRKTHRATGYACFVGGGLIILSSLLSNDYNLWISLGIVVLLIVFPTVFSMLYFRHKVKRNG
ncbi:MAG: SdpI family protein [Bacilli bacterium]|nr:SdpI family protein [Bacilli bacterium]MBQ9731295.1 SdpI family protein [Bacilli bacterium]